MQIHNLGGKLLNYSNQQPPINQLFSMASSTTTAPTNNSSIVIPPTQSFDNEQMQGSMQQILSDNIGVYIVVDFLIGTQAMTSKEGYLYSVGRDYITLFDDISNHYILCDIFSIRFVTFYPPGTKPAKQPPRVAQTAVSNGRIR